MSICQCYIRFFITAGISGCTFSIVHFQVGLRTLAVAHRRFTAEEYQRLDALLTEAKTSMQDREGKVKWLFFFYPLFFWGWGLGREFTDLFISSPSCLEQPSSNCQMVVVTFFLLVRILGERLTVHSPPVCFLF